ncbi:hypothetical protein BKA58DRAFT_351961 [Alternaria rosae]|uniref:uncharacterized protein n=1 Tax=Alternaria rosae TaxID=1187941 RepID=UPI001E8CD532|nr:uncharacterized protein BKA58DRAFT_351961 [Alternaria rosae]KAH6882796.1 hypothetical protein BKA58DRAFT_351961 [Alternaria rosae]
MSQRFGSPSPYSKAEGERRKRRRYLSRSDEEIREEMDPGYVRHRSGWPTLAPLPLDTVIEGVREMIPDEPQRLQDVQNILGSQGLLTSGTSFLFAFRVPRDATEENDDAEYLTLLITVDMLKHAHKVENALIRIRSSFRDRTSTDNVQIECVDFRAKHSMWSFAIFHDDDKVREQWANACPSVLSLLDNHEWLSVEVLRRGLIDDRQKCSPTIVITTPTARDSKWFENVVPSIKAEIADAAPDFDIEILCGVTMLGGRRRHRATEVVDGSSFVKNIGMGSSVGIANDEKCCSTLGGSVTLSGGIRCGITNWHCVRDERLDNVISKTTNKALGVDNKTLANMPQAIVSPATFDHHGYLGVLQDEIKLHGTYAAAGDVESKMEHKEKDEEYKMIEKFDRRIGNVYAGSGRRTVKANKYASDPNTGRSKDKMKALQATFLFPLDWALVRMGNTTKRDVINSLPNVRSTKTKLLAKQQCRQWSTFNVNKETVHVAKYGRTSGWTVGTINSCLLIINPDKDEEISDVYGFDAKNAGSCFGVTSKDGQSAFIELGDSGSILLHDESGTQLGLLFGVTGTGQGIFLPMDIVIQDIKRITGKDVIAPSYVTPPAVGLAPYQLTEEI